MSSSMVLEHYTFLSAQQSSTWRYSISTSSLYIRSPPSGETFIYRYVTVLLSTRGTNYMVWVVHIDVRVYLERLADIR